MAATTLDQLPVALALNGGELVWLYQQGPTEATPWIGVRGTTAQIAALITTTLKLPNAGYVSMRQLVAALASENLLLGVTQALPGDETNAFNIAWTHAYLMSAGDPFVVGFLQPTLGYTGAQITTLFAYAATFPV